MLLIIKRFMLILLIISPFNVAAAKVSKVGLEEVQSYLASLNSLESEFIQTDNATNSQRKGKLYISKPGKLKVEYYDGDKEIILLNNDIITVYNTALDERNYLANDDLPISLLAKQNFSLRNEADIHNFSTDAVHYNICFSLKSDKADRNITIKFSKSPIYITEIKISNDDSEIIMVLNNPKFNIPVALEAFE